MMQLEDDENVAEADKIRNENCCNVLELERNYENVLFTEERN